MQPSAGRFRLRLEVGAGTAQRLDVGLVITSAGCEVHDVVTYDGSANPTLLADRFAAEELGAESLQLATTHA
jgi:hypothetical protein